MAEKPSATGSLSRPASRIGKPVRTGVPAANERRPSVATTPTAVAQPENTKVESVTTEAGIFTIGETVVIPGGKQGKLLFIGETHFAKGEWAGVYLDEPAGKNNGAIEGKVYFSCPQNHGVFLKPMKLAKLELNTKTERPVESTPSTNGVHSVNQEKTNTLQKARKSAGTPVPSKMTSSNSNLSLSVNQQPPSFRSQSTTPANQVQMRVKPGMGQLSANEVKVGDTVFINGLKEGVVRFVGETEFATGLWVGVALPDKSGKNDGSVEGKRYFECEMGFGLFSPLSKVTKESRRPPSTVPGGTPLRPQSVIQDPRSVARHSTHAGGITGPPTASRRGSTTGVGLALSLQRDLHGGSSGSVSSISSATSSGANKLLKSQGGSQQQQIATAELLREAEVREGRLKDLVGEADRERLHLIRQLDEERRKVEDLHFRMEEESISKGEILSERNKLKHKFESAEETIADYHDQLEDLRKKFYDLEFQMQEQAIIDSDSGVSSGGMSAEVEETMRERERFIQQLENEVSELKSDKEFLESEVKVKKEIVAELTRENQKSVKFVQDLKHDICAKDLKYNGIESKIGELTSLKVSLEEQLSLHVNTIASLREEKSKLEATVNNLTGTSDNSDEKVNVLSNELKDKQSSITKLEDLVQSLTSEKSNLSAQFENTKTSLESELSKTLEKHKSELSNLEAQLLELNEQLSISKSELLGVKSENEILHSDVRERSEEISALTQQTESLKTSLSNFEEKVIKSETSKKELLNEIKTYKVQLDKFSDENKALKGKVGELAKLENEFSALLQEKSKTVEELRALQAEYKCLEDNVESVKEEKKTLEANLQEKEDNLKGFQKVLEQKAKVDTALLTTKKQLDVISEKYNMIKVSHEDLVEKSNRVVKLEAEISKVQTECTELKSRNQVLMEDYTTLESAHNILKSEAATSSKLKEEISVLQRENSSLKDEVLAKDSQTSLFKDSVSKYKAELDVALKKNVVLENTEKGGVAEQIKTERDALMKQVDFLNSVIVNLQQKNDVLTNKIEAFSRVATPPNLKAEDEEFDSPLVDFDHPIRPFCDICDEFDLHNTEDCPKQSQRPESPPQSYNRGNVVEPRPYCDSCEVFGHWTEDCNDDQMF